MGGVVLLTGASGFLGTEIAERLLEREDVRLVALVLAEDDDEAAWALSRAWSYRPDLVEAVHRGRLDVVAGDVRRAGLGVADDAREGPVGRVTHVIHAAADLRIDAAPEDLRPVNVAGVANVVAFAHACDRDHGLRRLSHVSTAYVAGGRRGEVAEDALDDSSGFENAYELTKYEGERLLRSEAGSLPTSVFRPGMIVGDSRTGEIRTFNTFYAVVRRYLTDHVRVVPASPRLRVNIVPVDHVADAIVRLTFDPRAEGRTFHLTAPEEELPTARELVGFVRGWARERLDVRLPPVVFVPTPSWRRTARSASELERRGSIRASGLAALRPYLRERRRFRRDATDRLLGPYPLRWRRFMPVLLEDAARRGFLHRSDRTVHEQALFRLGARSLPVRYRDIGPGRDERVGAAALRAEVLSATAALASRGVGPGTRVAVIGPNGTRYLIVDLAIGLAGAVSVPMYPTSPREDIQHILQASGAEMLFVGAADVLERLGPVGVPCVSFAREAVPAPIEGWDAFLEGGRSAPPVEPARVDLDDLATLRFTSGTTGPPKGVAFTHRQLRWMAETMTTLLPWRTRTRPVTYLSFLPMNHVVEGILGTYAPYYLPAPVDVAFLDDFGELARALRLVRPTVFFSVPRFYERLLDAAHVSNAGARFLALPEGRRKRLLRPVVRRRVLHRAGLDRCSQLMVGSAAVDDALLRGLEDLGIVVHDAYGLTEAPLVTLDRSGGASGSAGEPLPETAVRIADDGEILVRGPQVMVGYAGGGPQPFEGGWLRTGDLGHLTPEGALAIDGRKKDLLKTSYGKYLNPSKIESRLRAIPGVAQAMVIGEGRPFCTALLWLDGAVTSDRVSAIERAVDLANQGLSHPEQVKRWTVVEDDLSIQSGDLTPNLKLKRARVAERYRGAIDALYAGERASA